MEVEQQGERILVLLKEKLVQKKLILDQIKEVLFLNHNKYEAKLNNNLIKF